MPHTHLLHTQMLKAIENRDISTVKELINRGVQVNYINNSYASSAIEAATKLGDFEMVALLLSAKKANPNRWYMSNPLTIALDKGFLDIAHLLIDYGADVNIDPDMDMTPLMLAVHLNNLQLVKKLIDRGADVNAAGEESNSPLSIAASEGYKDIYDYLLPLINPSSLSEFLEEGVWCAITGNKSLIGIEFLASARANFNCRGNRDNTPLIHTIQVGSLSLAKKLIEVGADVNLKNCEGITALSLAKEQDNHEIVQILLKARAVND